mmetsp:Transcript_5648/g.14043  ORF Transcript_5648/g.14043 Transcript_5648/m.14043 type:complete len:313 (-) Transcript_5648:2925-3863(-)
MARSTAVGTWRLSASRSAMPPRLGLMMAYVCSCAASPVASSPAAAMAAAAVPACGAMPPCMPPCAAAAAAASMLALAAAAAASAGMSVPPGPARMPGGRLPCPAPCCPCCCCADMAAATPGGSPGGKPGTPGPCMPLEASAAACACAPACIACAVEAAAGVGSAGSASTDQSWFCRRSRGRWRSRSVGFTSATPRLNALNSSSMEKTLLIFRPLMPCSSASSDRMPATMGLQLVNTLVPLQHSSSLLMKGSTAMRRPRWYASTITPLSSSSLDSTGLLRANVSRPSQVPRFLSSARSFDSLTMRSLYSRMRT